MEVSAIDTELKISNGQDTVGPSYSFAKFSLFVKQICTGIQQNNSFLVIDGAYSSKQTL